MGEQGSGEISVLGICVTRFFVNGRIMSLQPVALASVGKFCRCCFGTDDWYGDADKSSLRTTREGVSRRLEMQRQVDEISAVQCRKRELAETSHSTKSATSEEATARLQPAKMVSGSTCWCPRRPRYVVGKTIVEKHAVIMMKMREKSADVMLLSVLMLSLEEYTLFVNGMVCIVLFRPFVKMWQNSGALAHTTRSKRWIGLTVSMGRRGGGFQYHLISHNMPTQSGGSARGSRHEGRLLLRPKVT